MEHKSKQTELVIPFSLAKSRYISVVTLLLRMLSSVCGTIHILVTKQNENRKRRYVDACNKRPFWVMERKHRQTELVVSISLAEGPNVSVVTVLFGIVSSVHGIIDYI